MEKFTRLSCASLSFIIPIIGITLYFSYSKKQDAKLYGMIGLIGIFVYVGIGLGFI